MSQVLPLHPYRGCTFWRSKLSSLEVLSTLPCIPLGSTEDLRRCLFSRIMGAVICLLKVSRDMRIKSRRAFRHSDVLLKKQKYIENKKCRKTFCNPNISVSLETFEIPRYQHVDLLVILIFTL